MDHISKPRHRGANVLKFFLMPFVCFACFGLPGKVGNYIASLSQFAPAAFFILCGFFTAERDDVGIDKNKKLIRRTALRFAILFFLYLVLAAIYYSILFLVPPKTLFLSILRKRVVFNFIVLCAWPFSIGAPIWFIQSLLYVRIGLWLLGKSKLTRLEKPLMILGFAAMLLTGELAHVVNFSFLGNSYIPVNWLTCAMPYMLLGKLVYEKRETLLSKRIVLWMIGFVVGTAMAFAEFTLLGKYGFLVYTGHAIGFGIAAFSLCCLFLGQDGINRNFFSTHGSSYAWRIYALSQPIALLVLIIAGYTSAELSSAMQDLGGIVIYPICLALAFVIGYLKPSSHQKRGSFLKEWNRWHHHHHRHHGRH